MKQWINATNILESGGAIVALLLGTGIWLTIKFKGFQLRGLPLIFKHTVGSLLHPDPQNRRGNISSFQAVTTALAGTMGVGNIVGVSTAIVAGGPGAVVWMWIGAFFGMMTKYAEIFLAVRHRRRDVSGRFYGGPMYYMQDGFGGRKLSCIFAILCAACSLGIGNMAQVNSISTALQSQFHLPLWVSGIGVACVITLVIGGGVARIAQVTEKIIPLISILYICIAGTYLYLHRAMLPMVFEEMFIYAFDLTPAAGGLAGYGVRQAMLTGLSRGVFTHEAGLGSAPIAHASADCSSPEYQGLWGIFEVFLDTIVVCTLTAFVILTAGNGQLWQSGLDGAPLTSAAFADIFGDFGSSFVAVAIVFYAISAMLGWCFYGESALRYLCCQRKNAIICYRVLFIVCIFIGATVELTTVWQVSDHLNALMAIPNILAILYLHQTIRVPNLFTRKDRT